MTKIRTGCPQCGEVEVVATSILLTFDDASGEGFYEFTCPSHNEVVRKDATRHVAQILRSVDVNEAFPDTAAKGVELAPEDRPDGEPLTHGDVIDFVVDLWTPGMDVVRQLEQEEASQ